MTSNHDVADAFLEALRTGDLAAVADLYADDITVWHDFDGVDQDKAAHLALLIGLYGSFDTFTLEVRASHPTAAGSVTLYDFVATKDGAHFRVPAAAVVSARDGKITRIEEYIDPTGFARPV